MHTSHIRFKYQTKDNQEFARLCGGFHSWCFVPWMHLSPVWWYTFKCMVLTHWPLIFKLILVIECWGISCEIALIWMSLYFTDDQWTLVHVMAWCRQAASHYLIQCWPRSLSPYGVTRPQWVEKTVSTSNCGMVERHFWWIFTSIRVLCLTQFLSIVYHLK